MDGSIGSPTATREYVPWYRILYVQVLIAIASGICLGWWFPNLGAAMKPLGDAFIALIKMMIAPVVFCTIVHGIGSMGDLKKVGRVGIKALVYFEVISAAALVIGLLVAEIARPGEGINIDPTTFASADVSTYVARVHEEAVVGHLLAIIPNSFFDALTTGDLLQVLLIAILTGIAISRMGPAGARIERAIEAAGHLFLRIIGTIIHAAPIGAFGAMAFTVGAYGMGALWNLSALILTFYGASLLFVLLVLGAIARTCGFSILRFVVYIRDELLIVLGTSSSETVLPQIMQKMERLGASRAVVGLVIPTGYSFNLDGTNIYMTLAILFLAQATNTPLTLSQEFTILAIAMLTSKGASGVTGAGFVTLAATLAIVPGIPVQALAILVGIDKFMSECRALTNLIGNGVATLVISRMEGELNGDRLRHALARPLIAGEARRHEMA